MNKLKKKKKGWRGAEMTQNTTQQVLQKAAIVKIRLFARFCNSFFFLFWKIFLQIHAMQPLLQPEIKTEFFFCCKNNNNNKSVAQQDFGSGFL